MILEIKSRQNDKIKYCLALKKPSFRNEEKKFLIEGFHLLEMALKAGVVEEIFTTKEVSDIPHNINVYYVTSEVLEKISSTKSPQGVVAICKMKSIKKVCSNKVLFLDDVSDPGNVGTLLRTALAFGYNDVIVTDKCASIYNEKVVQSSQGSIFDLNIIKNEEDVVKNLKNDGYQVIATEIKGSLIINELKPNSKHILVLGNEAHGVSQTMLDVADVRIRIDINNIESLNVGVAGGIAMYQLSK